MAPKSDRESGRVEKHYWNSIARALLQPHVQYQSALGGSWICHCYGADEV